MFKNRNISYVTLKPDEILNLYYSALYSGDLQSVKALMTEESYMMTLETFGLRLALRDTEFKLQLKEIKEDEDALAQIEKKLSLELISRKLSPVIEIKSTASNGAKRETIDYTEDKEIKKLYFSKEESGWKINYYAGRKVS